MMLSEGLYNKLGADNMSENESNLDEEKSLLGGQNTKSKKTKLAGRIKVLRSMCGLSTEGLARHIGCTEGVVYSWTKASSPNRPSIPSLFKLAQLEIENSGRGELCEIVKEWIIEAGYSLSDDFIKSQVELMFDGYPVQISFHDVFDILGGLDKIVRYILKDDANANMTLWELLFRLSQSTSRTEFTALKEALGENLLIMVNIISTWQLESLNLEELNYLTKFPGFEKFKSETIKDLLMSIRDK